MIFVISSISNFDNFVLFRLIFILIHQCFFTVLAFANIILFLFVTCFRMLSKVRAIVQRPERAYLTLQDDDIHPFFVPSSVPDLKSRESLDDTKPGLALVYIL